MAERFTMAGASPSIQRCKNTLLALLPDDEYQALARHLQLVPTPFSTVLFERDKPIEYVYFPCSGAHSVLAVMEDGAMVEVGTVGNEGMSTVDAIIGSEVATETIVCQIPGESLRLPLARFREATAGDMPLRRIAQRYLQAYLSQVSQSVACNRLHSIEERFARWVLMSHDRVPGDEFQLTQEYLAGMLGVHRPSVSLVARTFQQAGIIKYNRGTIAVLDRPALEDACCECYFVVRRQFERALGTAAG